MREKINSCVKKSGKLFDARFDTVNPPEYVKCFGLMKLGREYLLTTQQLDIYGTAQLTIVEGENHRISRKTKKVATLVTQFFKQH